MATTRRSSNEQEFQGELLGWLNEEIRRRQGLGLDRATQETPGRTSGKRNDIVIWKDRATHSAFLAIELKTPTTPINDPILFADAQGKAKHWGAAYFAIWNMRDIELYETPGADETRTPDQVLYRDKITLPLTGVEDWIKPAINKELRRLAINFLDIAHNHAATGHVFGQTIDSEIFVARLTDAINKLRGTIYRELTRRHSDKILRKKLNKMALEQGFEGFVNDIEYAIAGQIGYRLIGQVLFYYALRRKQPQLREIQIGPRDTIPDGLRTYWNDVRRFDYEALYKPDPIEDLIVIHRMGKALSSISSSSSVFTNGPR